MTLQVLVCSDEKRYNQLARKDIVESHFVAYRNQNGILEVMKNRFNGVTGVMSDEQFNKFVNLAENFYERVDNQ